MADCDFLTLCPFFNDKMENMPSAADMMKKLYCQWNYSQCARYMVAITLGREKIPSDLFPSDVSRAELLVIQHNHSSTPKC